MDDETRIVSVVMKYITDDGGYRVLEKDIAVKNDLLPDGLQGFMQDMYDGLKSEQTIF